MSLAATSAILMAFAGNVAWSQPLEGRPQFEVASVKPAGPPEQRAGGGVRRTTGGARTPDPSLFICDSCTLRSELDGIGTVYSQRKSTSSDYSGAASVDAAEPFRGAVQAHLSS